MFGKIYLIPNTLGSESVDSILPPSIPTLLNGITDYIVENTRNARRFLLRCGYNRGIDNTLFFELNKHTDPRDIERMLNPCLEGKDMGLISEAGMPGIADPGASVVKLAHQKRIIVVPVTGPSSLFLSLAASGLNGQAFRFHGYLPVHEKPRAQKIREMIADIKSRRETQIFIEAPYRNNQLLESLLKNCPPEIQLCIACDLTQDREFISTRTIFLWKKETLDFHKRPAVFLLGE